MGAHKKISRTRALKDLDETIQAWAPALDKQLAEDLAQEMRLAILEADPRGTPSYYKSRMLWRARNLVRNERKHSRLAEFLRSSYSVTKQKVV